MGSIPLFGLDLRSSRALGHAGLEAVLELARHGLEVARAAGAGGLPSLGLLAPVDCAVVSILLSCRGEPFRVLAGGGLNVHPLTLAAG